MDHIDDRLRSLRAEIASHIAAAADKAVPEDVCGLPELVRQRRLAIGWTLEQLADAAGTSKSHIWAIEKGRYPQPTVRMVDALARALGVPLIYMCAAVLRDDR